MSEAATTFRYQSRGRLLVIGTLAATARLDGRLAGDLVPTRMQPPDSRAGAGREPAPRITRLRGHLGAFEASYDDGEGTPRYAAFDMVLDLAEPALIVAELPPPGYFAPRDEATLRTALDELAGLTGTFEKPIFFRYEHTLCAHGDHGVDGCTRCLDACAAEAISSDGNAIVVDAARCQGCGACATRCPTGALAYLEPNTAQVLADIHSALAAAPADECRIVQVAATAPAAPTAGMIPLTLDEPAAHGMECWLGALAWGADGVVIVCPPGMPTRSRRVLEDELANARGLLAALGIAGTRIALADTDEDNRCARTAIADLPASDHATRGLLPSGDKRLFLRRALAALAAAGAASPEPVALPPTAPFGNVVVDTRACTLCMACVAQCPTHALRAGGDVPRLDFVEADCVQCGACRSTCPEQAISLSPRLAPAPGAAMPRELHRDEAFRCRRCATPFAPRSVIERMHARLARHTMFADPDARAALELCADCRAAHMLGVRGRSAP
ncbi:MAG: 4Fe-4S dicluster domain-containing protein [Gammaproteobacteria bacterium]